MDESVRPYYYGNSVAPYCNGSKCESYEDQGHICGISKLQVKEACDPCDPAIRQSVVKIELLEVKWEKVEKWIEERTSDPNFNWRHNGLMRMGYDQAVDDLAEHLGIDLKE